MALPEVGSPEDTVPVIALTGPTAGGKTAAALAIAEAFSATVVNADSMQVYRELEVLTARPGEAELARAPHRLYGCLSGREACSAGRWLALAEAEIAAARAAGRLPLLVGGTGLYLRALSEGLNEIPVIDEAVRRRVRARCEEIGAAALHRELAARDPEMAARLHPNDRQRLIRAMEVLEATGRSLADWHATGLARPPRYRVLTLALIPPRDRLYAACDARFGEMLVRGALEEVRVLLELALDPGLPVMKAVGVPELATHLRGETSLDAAVAAAQQATRRYAKRQMTWLRTQSGRNNPSCFHSFEQFSETNRQRIFAKIREFLLTPPK